jgi:hypothetical protein
MLGRNTHCAAVRRRIAAAKAAGREPDAAIKKGRYLLSPDAHDDELKHPRPSNDVRKREDPDEPPPSSHSMRLAEKLRRLK